MCKQLQMAAEEAQESSDSGADEPIDTNPYKPLSASDQGVGLTFNVVEKAAPVTQTQSAPQPVAPVRKPN